MLAYPELKWNHNLNKKKILKADVQHNTITISGPAWKNGLETWHYSTYLLVVLPSIRLLRLNLVTLRSSCFTGAILQTPCHNPRFITSPQFNKPFALSSFLNDCMTFNPQSYRNLFLFIYLFDYNRVEVTGIFSCRSRSSIFSLQTAIFVSWLIIDPMSLMSECLIYLLAI